MRETGRASDGRPLTVYASQETHTWIQKSTDLSGLGTDAIRWIPTGQDHRMDVGALERALDEDLAAGFRPMMVVGTGGSVSTGAVDPLGEIAEVCKARDVWFHVDGAYGGFAAMLPEAPEDLKRLDLADSVAVDPHKWLYAPLEAGCALVKDSQRLRDAFSYHPPYYHFGVEATNYVDFGPQNSRGFRALKVWLAFRQYEYEICLRCHGDAPVPISQRIARQADQPNLRLKFNPGNPSFHPLVVASPTSDTPSFSIAVPSD